MPIAKVVEPKSKRRSTKIVEPEPQDAPASEASTPVHPAPSRMALLGSLLGILIMYVVAAAFIARERSIWSPDCGARLVQVQSILQHWPYWHISYPAAPLDPQHENSPLYFFGYNHNGYTYIFYSFLFALLSAIFFKPFGYFGLAILPILGGLATALATYGIARLLRLRYPLAPMLIAALVTPIAIYSVVFWDHSVTTGIANVCLYLSLRAIVTGRIWLWLAVGALLGAGLWLHEILVPFIPGFIMGALWALWHSPRRSARPAPWLQWLQASALLVLGVALLVVPLTILNKSVYGTPFGPHLSNNRLGSGGDILKFMLKPGEWLPGALYTLFAWGDTNPAFTWELKDWLANPTAWPRLQEEVEASRWMAVPVIGWVVLALSGFWRQAWVLSLLLFAGMLASALWILRHTDLVHSQFLVCPFLVLAFAASMRRPSPRRTGKWDSNLSNIEGESDEAAEARLLRQTIAIVIGFYTCMALVKPSLGGTEWGSRHLLAIVPGLTLLAWSTVETLLPLRNGGHVHNTANEDTNELVINNGNVHGQSDKNSRSEKTPSLKWRLEVIPLLVGVVVLLGVSVAMQVHGFNTVYGMHRKNRLLTDAIEQSPDKVIVSAVWWVPMDAAAIYERKQMLFVDGTEHPALPLFQRLRDAGVKNYTFVGYSSEDPYAGAMGYVPIPDSVRQTEFTLYLTRYQLLTLPAMPPQTSAPESSRTPSPGSPTKP